jgi:hypothetical protein
MDTNETQITEIHRSGAENAENSELCALCGKSFVNIRVNSWLNTSLKDCLSPLARVRCFQTVP